MTCQPLQSTSRECGKWGVPRVDLSYRMFFSYKRRLYLNMSSFGATDAAKSVMAVCSHRTCAVLMQMT